MPQKGFTPARTVAGGTGGDSPSVRYTASVSAAIFIGDPLRVSASVVKPIGTAVSAQFVGSAVRCYDANGKPFTFSQPTRGPFKPAATSGFVDVALSPMTTYVVATKPSVVVSANMIGVIVNVTAGTPNSASGRSGYMILATAASAGDGQFKIIGVAPEKLGAAVSAGDSVEVVSVRPITTNL